MNGHPAVISAAAQAPRRTWQLLLADHVPMHFWIRVIEDDVNC